MGIDAEIYFELLSGNEPDDVDVYPLKNIGEIKRFGEPHECGATHFVDTLCRLYDFNYERGPWCLFSGLLMQLVASPNVGRVWYFGDHVDPIAPITPENVLALSKHYMAHGERPYRQEGYRQKMKEQNQ